MKTCSAQPPSVLRVCYLMLAIPIAIAISLGSIVVAQEPYSTGFVGLAAGLLIFNLPKKLMYVGAIVSSIAVVVAVIMTVQRGHDLFLFEWGIGMYFAKCMCDPHD